MGGIVAAGLLLSGAAAAILAQEEAAPIVTEARAGPCRMKVSGGGAYFLVTVTGLRPGEPLQIRSRSEGELLEWSSMAQDDGRWGSILIPLVKGKTFGTATIEVTGQRCRIEASYPWRE